MKNDGIYYYNVCEGVHRDWDDYVRLGFISAGHDDPGHRSWSEQIRKFEEGDAIAAYLTWRKEFRHRGYVGVGVITARARPVREVKIGDRFLRDCDLKCRALLTDIDSDQRCEYVARVRWIKVLPREQARWIPNEGLFASSWVRASLANQPGTIEFLNREFGPDLWSGSRQQQTV